MHWCKMKEQIEHLNHSQREALSKLMKYCAYQDRCQLEVEERLKGFELNSLEKGEVIIALSRGGFLDEERFAKSYVRGKFYFKDWGRAKIVQELKRRKISEYCIRKGLEEIKETDYQTTLSRLFEKKWNSLKGEKNIWVKRKKTSSYLYQKGYEPELIQDVLK